MNNKPTLGYRCSVFSPMTEGEPKSTLKIPNSEDVKILPEDLRTSQRNGAPYQGHSFAPTNGMQTPSYDREKQGWSSSRKATRQQAYYPLDCQYELRYPSPAPESYDRQARTYERNAENDVRTEYTSSAPHYRPAGFEPINHNPTTLSYPPRQRHEWARMQPTRFEPLSDPLNHNTMKPPILYAPAARLDDDVSYSQRKFLEANTHTKYTSSAQNRAIRPDPVPDFVCRPTAPSNPFSSRPELNQYSNVVPGALSNLSSSPQYRMPTGFEPPPDSGYSPIEAFKEHPKPGQNSHIPVASAAWPLRAEAPQTNRAPIAESNLLPTLYPTAQPSKFDGTRLTCSSSQPHIIQANGLSQYTSGAASSCIPSCMEACLQLVYGSRLRLATLYNILKAGSRYRGADHIEAGKLQASVRRYSEALRVVVEQQYPITEFERVVRDLVALAKDEGQPVAAVVTKPPESIMVAVDPRSETPVVLFDSHPRPDIHPDSAAFLCFEDQHGLVEYLHQIMPSPQDLDLEDLDAYTAMIIGFAWA
ncbi:hypothetical protein BC938DRAFT_482671 [Jimgerdemannia flammicorona]|uniref:Uncharacterized protein n=1 Tax=Jimgerdemannia flammicorona TaxID=994334 RepID=A0A433QDJ7_9FUNG|nr:hypothetical protein BC938DRAFT_482671 [Jimgerdemannia flammicorona]